MAWLQKKNNAKSTINMGGGLAQSATSLTVADGSKFPSLGDFLLTIWDKTTYQDPGNDPNMEIVRATARSTDVITISRGKEGTADVAHANGQTVEMLITAGLVQEIEGVNNLEIKTDTYNVLKTDMGKTLVMNSGSDKIFNLPSVDANDVGLWFTFINIGTGEVTIDGNGSDTIDDEITQTLYQWETICIQNYGSGVWVVI